MIRSEELSSAPRRLGPPLTDALVEAHLAVGARVLQRRRLGDLLAVMGLPLGLGLTWVRFVLSPPLVLFALLWLATLALYLAVAIGELIWQRRLWQLLRDVEMRASQMPRSRRRSRPARIRVGSV